MEKQNSTSSEIDNIFEEAIGRWERLLAEVWSGLTDLKRLLDTVNDPEDLTEGNSYSILNIAAREVERILDKAETLNESLSGASLIKPIDELEAKTISAIREVEKIEQGRYYSEIYNALTPLFALAQEKVENYSLPAWIKRRLHSVELGQQTEGM